MIYQNDYLIIELIINQSKKMLKRNITKNINVFFSFTGRFWRSWIIEQACRNRQDQL